MGGCCAGSMKSVSSNRVTVASDAAKGGASKRPLTDDEATRRDDDDGYDQPRGMPPGGSNPRIRAASGSGAATSATQDPHAAEGPGADSNVYDLEKGHGTGGGGAFTASPVDPQGVQSPASDGSMEAERGGGGGGRKRRTSFKEFRPPPLTIANNSYQAKTQKR